ncbi:hypothetical protein LLEC1_04175 [Akanthomyces lecanii]|uniref:Uncharacterized protein n=1 Tax=Cordyceps confragosa TaxID=2714763 RepID=A0A179I354_CORDF|nr:hypothetical protein LLEC1_04175 [Akanthomyces lecanii]
MDYVEQRMTQEAAKGPASDSLFTPLNVILVSAVVYVVYTLFRAPAKHEIPKPPPPVDMLTKDLDGPLDPLKDLDAEQIEAVQGWEARFTEKYEVVGRLVSAADFEAQK